MKWSDFTKKVVEELLKTKAKIVYIFRGTMEDRSEDILRLEENLKTESRIFEGYFCGDYWR